MLRVGKIFRPNESPILDLAAPTMAPDAASGAIAQRRLVRVIGIVKKSTLDTFTLALFVEELCITSAKILRIVIHDLTVRVFFV